MSDEGILHVALHDGFDGVEVSVLVDGREVFRGTGVQTDPRTNLARSIEVPWRQPPGEIEVRLPTMGVSGATVLTSSASWVGVDVVGRVVRFTLSEGPFGYA